MKIAVINVTLGEGSTGKVTQHIYEDLKDQGHDVSVYYGVRNDLKYKGKRDFYYFGNKVEWYITHIVSRFTGLSGALSFFSTIKLLKWLDDYEPDVIWLYNLHGGYVNEYWLLNYAKKNSKWTIYLMADEYPFLGKCCYSFDCVKYKTEEGCHHCKALRDSPRSYIDNSRYHFMRKKKAYEGFENITFVSAPYVVHLAKESRLLKDKKFLEIDTQVDILNTYYPRDTAKIRRELNIPDKNKVAILCASYNAKYKGVKYFLEVARLCENDDITFINVGYDGDIDKCPSNYKPLPYVSDQGRLSELLSLADVYVCTSICDAQPNACLNALGCGTPIIGFNISGVPYVASEKFGTFVTPFDINEMANAIRMAPRKNEKMIEECHQYALDRFGINKAKNGYHVVLDNALKEY